MLVIEWQNFLENGLPIKGKKSSMTVGIFDGVHRGHKALLERIVLHNADYSPVVITFLENHKVMNNEQRDIQSFRQRLEIFEKLGIQITIVIDFSEQFRQMPGKEFLEIILKRGNAGFFAAGNNFRCGCGLDTCAAAIQEFFAARSIPAEIIPEVMEGSLAVSSSRIREAIASGDTALAKAMLGRNQLFG